MLLANPNFKKVDKDNQREVILPDMWRNLVSKHGDKEVAEHYWALVTTDAIPGSRGSTNPRQWVKGEYELPSVLEAMALAIMDIIPAKPCTLTLCKEMYSIGLEWTVGDMQNSDFSIFPNVFHYDPKDFGILALRNLSRRQESFLENILNGLGSK